MTKSTDPPPPPLSMDQFARDCAAKASDPQDAETLLRSAEKIERVEREWLETEASIAQDIERLEAEMKAVNTSDHLPTWAVMVILILFVALIVYGAVKHSA